MDALLKKMNYKLGPIVVLGAPKEFGPILDGWKAEVEVLQKLPAAGNEKKRFSFLFSPPRRQR
jgi:hypothetical protein